MFKRKYTWQTCGIVLKGVAMEFDGGLFWVFLLRSSRAAGGADVVYLLEHKGKFEMVAEMFSVGWCCVSSCAYFGFYFLL